MRERDPLPDRLPPWLSKLWVDATAAAAAKACVAGVRGPLVDALWRKSSYA